MLTRTSLGATTSTPRPLLVLVGAEGGPGVSEHPNPYPYVHFEYRDYYSPMASPGY